MKITVAGLEARDLYNAGTSFDAQDPMLRLSISGNIFGQTKRAVDAGINAEWDEESAFRQHFFRSGRTFRLLLSGEPGNFVSCANVVTLYQMFRE